MSRAGKNKKKKKTKNTEKNTVFFSILLVMNVLMFKELLNLFWY